MQAQVVVIGGGAFGASCFYHLTGQGVRDVVLLEQATLGSGSTGRSAAVVETQYLAPDQVALCAWSIRVFQRLEREHALPFVHHGYLRLGHSAADVAASTRASPSSARRAPRRARDRARRDRAHRAGAPRGRPGGALWGPSDGYVDAVRYCELLAGLGRAAGGRVLQGRRATGLRLRGGRVTAVECDGEAIECETVVNASGAWARAARRRARADAARRRLSAPAGPVRAAASAHDARADGDRLRAGRRARGALLPGRHAGPDRRRPPLGGARRGGAPADPDAFRQSVDWDYAERVAEALAARYRGAADFRVTGGWAGLYPLTPDTRPIVGPTPGIDGLYQALGGGGVGVQISPAIGAIVAELVTTGETTVMPDWARYRLDRFAPGAASLP